jgi:prevent-host-death family protein
MSLTAVSIAEGKKELSKLIRTVRESKEEIILTNRGKPVAVIMAYDEYRHAKRTDGYRKIMEARSVFLKAGIQEDEIQKKSRKQLEKRA